MICPITGNHKARSCKTRIPTRAVLQTPERPLGLLPEKSWGRDCPEPLGPRHQVGNTRGTNGHRTAAIPWRVRKLSAVLPARSALTLRTQVRKSLTRVAPRDVLCPAGVGTEGPLARIKVSSFQLSA